jgi:hypothetical protein
MQIAAQRTSSLHFAVFNLKQQIAEGRKPSGFDATVFDTGRLSPFP